MKKIVPTIVFIVVIVISSFAQDDKPKTGGAGSGSGSGAGTGNTENIKRTELKKVKPAANSPLKILSKPRALHTDEARKNNVQGRVSLRVTFKKDGKIGKIEPVSGLPNGLTESAVEAAAKIKFEPQRRNGKPVTITKVVEYSFTLY